MQCNTHTPSRKIHPAVTSRPHHPPSNETLLSLIILLHPQHSSLCYYYYDQTCNANDTRLQAANLIPKPNPTTTPILVLFYLFFFDFCIISHCTQPTSTSATTQTPTQPKLNLDFTRPLSQPRQRYQSQGTSHHAAMLWVFHPN